MPPSRPSLALVPAAQQPSDARIAELEALGMGFFYAGPISDSVSPEAARPQCLDHPDGKSYTGFGYAGGGYGPYQRCKVCHVVFAKGQQYHA